MHKVHLRPLTLEDISVIHSWPVYPAEFGQMDYALRNKGWLADYYCKPESWIYAAKVADEIIAYSLLAKTDSNSAEFRIALHPHKLHQGYGKIITQMTLHKGFLELDFTRIYLIVRSSNTTAFRLYQSFGFQVNGNCTKIVNHESVEFIEMELLRLYFTNAGK